MGPRYFRRTYRVCGPLRIPSCTHPTWAATPKTIQINVVEARQMIPNKPSANDIMTFHILN